MLLKTMSVTLKGAVSGVSYRFKKLLNMPQYPTFLIYHLTNQCNSRCIMCNIWQKKADGELTTEQIGRILGSKTFSKLRWINLTGGEPMLRKDVVDVVKILNTLPKLEGIAIPSNGFATDLVVRRAKEMLASLDKNKFLSITLSIDGFAQTHEKIRGVKDAYKKVTKTLDELKKLEKQYKNFNVGVQPTISKINLHEIEDFYKEMKKKTKNIGFAVVLESEGYYDNKNSPATLTSEDKKYVAKFLRKVMHEQPQYSFYYSKLIEMFDGSHRNFGCLAGYITLYMDPFGNIFPCPVLSANKKYHMGNLAKNPDVWFENKNIRQRLKYEKECKHCTMMCDLINMAKVEFWEHSFFMLQHPKIAKKLTKKIFREKNPYF
ncbi:MAG: radical SAM protein [Candidatus Nanoarchaeia archaeon]